MVEKEIGKKMKALRSENGGEFLSHSFKYFYAKGGIQRALITPHNPQWNGVGERENMRIVGETRHMLYDQGL